ncbi:MAG: GAF domain-containing protein [Caldilineaceae bacterium]|nr:GAF domain-containing protein [Caldilineaceae bacterium]
MPNRVPVSEQVKEDPTGLSGDSEKMLTSLNDHFVVFDHNWRYIYVNDAAARVLGLPKEQLMGNVIWELFPEAIGNQFYQELHRARDEGEDIVSEHYYQPWDAWFENRIYVLPDSISVLSIDITARKKAVTQENTERKEVEERLQVIHQVSEAVNRAEEVEQIYELALSGLERVFHVSRASIMLADQQGVMHFQAWRGLSSTYRERADGQSPRSIDEANPLPVLISDVSKADLGDQKQAILDEGIQAMGFIPLVEQKRLLGKFMLYYSQPHEFSEAEVQWAQTIARHVAHALQRKQEEVRLQTYTQTLEALNHVQLSLAAELDLEKLLQMVTDVSTKLSGAQFGAFFYNLTEEGANAYTLYALAGTPHEDFADFHMPRATALFAPTFRGEGVVRLADVTKDPRYGKNAPYFGLPPDHLPIRSYLAVPVVSREDEVIGGLFFGHSHPGVFTEQVEQLVSGIASQSAIMIENARLYAQLKEREVALRELNATLEQRVEKRTAELQRSNHELDQFAYVASHDLKAPLRAIHHLASWIAQDANEFLPGPSQEHLSKLLGRVRRMETLLDDMLAYSRASRQRHPAEEVAVAELVADVIEMIAPPHGFTVRILGKLPVIWAERSPLETVFRNLIGNAIKHHHRPAEGNVEIRAQEQEHFVEFTVKDDGPGIDPGFHQRIFEMFQTLQPRDLVEGSGVGLAIVKKSIESRGGTVQVESSRGEGALFRFTWPKRAASQMEEK